MEKSKDASKESSTSGMGSKISTTSAAKTTQTTSGTTPPKGSDRSTIGDQSKSATTNTMGSGSSDTTEHRQNAGQTSALGGTPTPRLVRPARFRRGRFIPPSFRLIRAQSTTVGQNAGQSSALGGTPHPPTPGQPPMMPPLVFHGYWTRRRRRRRRRGMGRRRRRRRRIRGFNPFGL